MLKFFKKKRFVLLAKEGVWVIIGKVVSFIGALALVKVLTKNMSPSDYGTLSLVMTIVALYAKVVFGGVTAGISRYFSVAIERKKVREYIGACKRMMAYSTLISLGVALLTLAIATLFDGHLSSIYLLLACLYSVVLGYIAALNGVQNAARRRPSVAFHRGLESIFKVIIVLLAATLVNVDTVTVILSYVIASLLVMASQLLFLRKMVQPLVLSQVHVENSARWGRKIWSYSWPFSAWGIFTWMQLASDRWALNYFTTGEEVGLYAVLFQVGFMPTSLALGLLMNFLAPILYQKSGDGTSTDRNIDVSKVIWIIASAGIIATAIAILAAKFLHREVFEILTDPLYWKASHLLPEMVAAGGVFSVGQMLALKAMSEMNTYSLLAPKIISAISGVLFNIAGAFYAGLNGVVSAMLVYSLMYCAWIYILSKRNRPTSD